MRVRRSIVSALLAMSLIGAVTTAAHADGQQPANDDRANATPVTAVPFEAQVDTTAASNELDEPTECGAMTNSVWWRVTLPTSTELRISTATSSFDTVIAVYEETVGGDQFVGCDDDSGGGGTSRLSMTTEVGATYLVQVGAWSSWQAGGDLRIAFTEFVPLGNDSFEDAHPLTGQHFEVEASTHGATKEDGEPLPCDRLLLDRTVWFRWTAPVNGVLDFSASGHVIGLYEGTSFDSLTPVGCGRGYGDASVTAGAIYHLQVGVNDLGTPPIFTLRGWLSPTHPPGPNDHLADAETVGALDEFHESNISGATLEPGEQRCGGTTKTLWYRFTATETGPLVATTEGSDGDTTLAVYTGTSHNDLAEVVCNDDGTLTASSRAGFVAEAGQSYLIQVGAGDSDWWFGNGDVRVGLRTGVAAGDGVPQATVTVTPDEYRVDEVGVDAAAVAVRRTPGYTVVCAFAVFIGVCSGGGP